MENPLENWGVTWQRNPKTWTNPWIFVTFRCFVRPEWVLTPIQKGPNPGFDPSFLIPVLIGGFTENLYFIIFSFSDFLIGSYVLYVVLLIWNLYYGCYMD